MNEVTLATLAEEFGCTVQDVWNIAEVDQIFWVADETGTELGVSEWDAELIRKTWRQIHD